ncbi:hypothetical protein [Massilia sp. S19_KUP03_FR1]|uniref:hypothetical protein n=1 Tax=Massilia sp. S19_KUP03_FR1 TaxID=3025503 RepID=UPI002FCD86E1
MSAAHRLRWVGAEAFVAAPVRPAPAILRFDGDDFMDRMLALLADTPQRLPELVARHESWLALGAPTPAAPPDATMVSQRVRLLRRGRALLGFRRQAHPAASTALALAAPLKLFQPVHQRYYVAAAHLVCELPGLPPRVTAGADKSGFVLRRFYKVANQSVEHAFVKSAGQPGLWVPLAAPSTRCADDEEWLPVFPLNYAPPAGPRRALLGGLIPVARHDDFQYARRASSAQPDGDPAAWSVVDNARALAHLRVIAPWQGLIERAYLSGATNNAELEDPPWDAVQPGTGKKTVLASANDQLVEASWRQLQEMREFFQSTFSELTDARLASGLAPPGRPQLQALLDLLGMATWAAPGPDVPSDDQPQLSGSVLLLTQLYKQASLRAALAAMTPALSKALDAAELAFPEGPGWPDFAFPLVALLGASGPVPRLSGPFRAWPGFPPAPVGPPEDEQDADNRRLELLSDRIGAAIAEASAAGTLVHAAQSSSAARLAADLAHALADDSGPARYALRFVHRRCDCGPLQPLVISAPSAQFQLAGFFDTDAPLRPIRIALPFDTTPGGLRKYGKNSAFIMSDVLCGQMKRMRRMGFGDMVRSVLPWPFHKKLRAGAGAPCGAGSAGGNFGTICSLSIPIITIVAFILLIVIATLLDLIFRWLPFLIACFPVPGLKGKRE